MAYQPPGKDNGAQSPNYNDSGHRLEDLPHGATVSPRPRFYIDSSATDRSNRESFWTS